MVCFTYIVILLPLVYFSFEILVAAGINPITSRYATSYIYWSIPTMIMNVLAESTRQILYA